MSGYKGEVKLPECRRDALDAADMVCRLDDKRCSRLDCEYYIPGSEDDEDDETGDIWR